MAARISAQDMYHTAQIVTLAELAPFQAEWALTMYV
jgi:hypothetical protein